MMPLSGVRSSCDMFARNSLFMRFACCSVCSKRRRSVTSRIALETNTPSSVSSGLRLISTGNSSPFLRRP